MILLFMEKSRRTLDDPTLLLFDNCESELCADIINLTKASGVHILKISTKLHQ